MPGTAKIDDAIVRQMREMRANGCSLAQISEKTGVSLGTVQRYCAGIKKGDDPLEKENSTFVEGLLPDSLRCTQEVTAKPNIVVGVINGRKESDRTTVFVPDYRREVQSELLQGTYKFGPVEYSVDSRTKSVTVLNLAELEGETQIKDIDRLLHYAEALVGICKTLKTFGKVKVFNDNK